MGEAVREPEEPADEPLAVRPPDQIGGEDDPDVEQDTETDEDEAEEPF